MCECGFTPNRCPIPYWCEKVRQEEKKRPPWWALVVREEVQP